jgi:hypothetical protein
MVKKEEKNRKIEKKNRKIGKIEKNFWSESGLFILNFLSSTVIDGEENFVFWSKKKKYFLM